MSFRKVYPNGVFRSTCKISSRSVHWFQSYSIFDFPVLLLFWRSIFREGPTPRISLTPDFEPLNMSESGASEFEGLTNQILIHPLGYAVPNKQYLCWRTTPNPAELCINPFLMPTFLQPSMYPVSWSVSVSTHPHPPRGGNIFSRKMWGLGGGH